jgi:uncharacterized iron-regulated protein
LPVLAAAGFDAGSWQWPLHEPLFAPLLSAGLAVHGGNITREQARLIAREGGRAVPAELMALLAASPLSDTQRAALDEALIKGHCGTLSPGPRLEAMRWAQRARDAALWAALDSVGTGARRTAVLLAGNGHVRLDHGVGQMARTLRPNLRVMAVGFLEDGDEVPRAAYSHLVVTRPAQREDPCRAFERRG